MRVPSREEQRIRLRAALAGLADVAEALREFADAEDGEDRDLFWRGVQSVERIYEYPPLPHPIGSAVFFSALSASYSALAGVSQSTIYCNAPPDSPVTCDMVLSPSGSPHFRCHHAPNAHCYDLSGNPVNLPGNV
jgi:hypothetical protein